MEYEKIIRDKFSELFEKNKEVERIFRNLKTGRVDYIEASKFAEAIGDILAETFGSTLDEYGESLDVVAMAEEVVERMLEQNFRLSSLVCDVVQGNLNASAGLGINPVAPSFDKERAANLVEKVREVGTVESARVFLTEDVSTYTQSIVDEWVKTNAEFQNSLGISAKVVRIWSGKRPSHDTRGTDWCEKLAGVYNYGDKSFRSSVFKRHRGCRCIVSYYPEGSTKGSLTALAKGEKDTAGVLWNTGKVTSYTREAVLRRRREQYGKEEARKILNEEWKGGRNGQAERHF